MGDNGVKELKKGLDFLPNGSSDEDLDKALFHLRKSAAEGNLEACFHIASTFFSDEFTFQDINASEALSLLKKSSDNGHLPSSALLACVYEICLRDPNIFNVVDKDISVDNLLKFAHLGAEGGIAPAQSQLGKLYAHGILVDRDEDLGKYWYGLSADQGDLFGLAGYSSILMKQPDTFDDAIKYAKIGADKGDNFCQVMLGLCYMVKPRQDYKKAKYWLETAAKQHVEIAYFPLFQIYELGLGVDPDQTKALLNLRMGAELGCPEAQCLLGELYLSDPDRFYIGSSEEFNTCPPYWFNNLLAQGLFWLELAANQGDGAAQLSLCKHYEWTDLFDEENQKKADYWLDRALAQEYPEAIEYKANRLIEGDPSEYEDPDYFGNNDNEENLNIVRFPNSNTENPLISQKEMLKNEIKEEVLRELTALNFSNNSIFRPASTADLIKNGETQELEFKETFSLDTRTGKRKSDEIRYAALREICGFLNTRAGTLIIGVTDNQEVVGIEKDGFTGDRDKYSLTISNLIEAGLGAVAASLVTIEYETIDKKTVCLIKVEKGASPAYLNFKSKTEKVFVRYGSITKEPPPSEWDRWCSTKFA